MAAAWITLRYVRDTKELARPRIERGPSLVFPLERAVIDVRTDGLSEKVDRASFVLVPAGASYELGARGSVAPVLVLVVGPRAISAAAAEYAPHFQTKAFARITAAPRLFARTRWVDEIVQRYLFERDVCRRDASAAARFLETEITKELYFLGKEQLEARERASVVHEDDDVVARARAFLESRLFEPFSMRALAAYVHASESTLLRAFRRAVGSPPAAWVRERRLEESRLLLESGRYTVGEVADRVGYGTLASFTAAFSRRFGAAPSSVRPRAKGELLPPHGTPPRKRRSRRSRANS